MTGGIDFRDWALFQGKLAEILARQGGSAAAGKVPGLRLAREGTGPWCVEIVLDGRVSRRSIETTDLSFADRRESLAVDMLAELTKGQTP